MRSPYLGERCADYSANRATIARARPTRIGRSAGVADEAVRSFGKPRVGDEARGSPPAGPHGFENWRRPALCLILIVGGLLIMMGQPDRCGTIEEETMP